MRDRCSVHTFTDRFEDCHFAGNGHCDGHAPFDSFARRQRFHHAGVKHHEVACGEFHARTSGCDIHPYGFEFGERRPNERNGDGDRESAFGFDRDEHDGNGLDVHDRELHAKRRAGGGNKLSRDHCDGECVDDSDITTGELGDGFGRRVGECDGDRFDNYQFRERRYYVSFHYSACRRCHRALWR